mgnify:CR=1 FL=1
MLCMYSSSPRNLLLVVPPLLASAHHWKTEKHCTIPLHSWRLLHLHSLSLAILFIRHWALLGVRNARLHVEQCKGVHQKRTPPPHPISAFSLTLDPFFSSPNNSKLLSPIRSVYQSCWHWQSNSMINVCLTVRVASKTPSNVHNRLSAFIYLNFAHASKLLLLVNGFTGKSIGRFHALIVRRPAPAINFSASSTLYRLGEGNKSISHSTSNWHNFTGR